MRLGFVVGLLAVVPFLPTTWAYAAPEATTTAVITAYTSSEDETDDTPMVNAAGTEPGPGSVACPVRLPLGTKVRIGTTVYTCDDRMGRKHQQVEHYDIWVPTKAEAFRIGRQRLAIAVLP